MKRNILLTAVLILSVLFSTAQEFYGKKASEKIPGSILLRYSDANTNPTYIEFPAAQGPLEKDLFVWLKETFKTGNSGFSEVNRISDELGFEHIRYQQNINGVPILHAIFIAHVRNGTIHSVNGIILPEPDAANEFVISGENALTLALNYTAAEIYKWQNPDEEAWIKSFYNDPAASWMPIIGREIIKDEVSGKLRNCYKFDIYAEKPLSRRWVYVDAETGEILRALDRLQTTDVPGVAVTKFSGTQNITTDSTAPGSYRLRESGRGNGIVTQNMNQGTSYSAAVDFTDSDNYWNNVNAQKDEVATDAHWGAEKTYDYYWLVHGRNSIDGNGFALYSYVHYDQNYANAFWDGQRMTYGDGNGSYQPFTALDICAHEITHGLTSFTADLIYSDESGALNEAYSDIFGIAVEYYARPSSSNWTMGEDIGVILRNIANPNVTQNPDTYLGTNWDPGMQVHKNSTVFSHWYYRVVMGGSGTNDLGNSFSVTGIGRDKASAIAFRMLSVYLTNSSGFADARFYAIIAATDLYGGCSPEVAAVTNAMYAVGIGGPYVPNAVADFSAAATSYCSAPIDVQFTNLSTNGQNYLWKFGDGNTSTLSNPLHTYAAHGDYDVTLVTDGGPCGIDSITIQAFISIQPGNSGFAIMPASGTGAVQTCCTGTLQDNGGNGNYGNNLNGVITIAPVGASKVTLNFTSFNLEAGYDYLYIYDGPFTYSPVIGAFDGNSLPNGGSIQSSGGAITLRFVSDAGVVASGFDLNWQCSMPNTAPTANFTASATTSCTGVIQFTDLSYNGPVNWLWNFGDGNTSSLQNPTHAYAANGTYSVTLKTTNSFGSDSLIKPGYIQVAMPAAPATTAGSVCDSGSVTLSAIGSGQLDWFDQPVGGNLLHTGSSFTTPLLYTTTNFYVEDKIIPPSVYGGKPNNSGSGGYFGNPSNVHYLIFNSYTPIKLVSVKVYAGSPGNRTILLRDSLKNVLASWTGNIPAGESRVTLNFDIPTANKLQLVGDGNPDLYRNNNGSASFPYTTAGLFSITETSASLPPYNSFGNYYYFYDWEVKEPTCISPRIAVTATVEPCGNVNENPAQNTVTIYPNPAPAGNFTISFNSPVSSDYLFEINDLRGRLVYSQQIRSEAGNNLITLSPAALSPGVFFVTISSNENKFTGKLVVY